MTSIFQSPVKDFVALKLSSVSFPECQDIHSWCVSLADEGSLHSVPSTTQILQNQYTRLCGPIMVPAKSKLSRSSIKYFFFQVLDVKKHGFAFLYNCGTFQVLFLTAYSRCYNWKKKNVDHGSYGCRYVDCTIVKLGLKGTNGGIKS
ncbi:hypothetical protein GJAV_G00043800 [Gymnothorax javanicus]|nr:hypothetical protein GJAV_G00043800 [Gymnothorax javanicus]